MKSRDRIQKSSLETDSVNISTGEHETDRNLREIVYPFGKYEIKVLIDEYGTFKGIREIKINKDFRSIKQKIESTGYIDVEDIYKDE
jgi:hypothetical protein